MNPNVPCAPGDRALKSLLRALIDRLGGLDAAASIVRVGRSQLSSYGDPGAGNAFVPADVLAHLEAAAGEPLVTAELARRANCALLPLTPIGGGDLAGRFARLGAETGQAFSAYADAIADGHLSAEDSARIAREAQEVLAAAQAILALLAPRMAPHLTGLDPFPIMRGDAA
jgi:hypothetical protein